MRTLRFRTKDKMFLLDEKSIGDYIEIQIMEEPRYLKTIGRGIELFSFHAKLLFYCDLEHDVPTVLFTTHQKSFLKQIPAIPCIVSLTPKLFQMELKHRFVEWWAPKVEILDGV